MATSNPEMISNNPKEDIKSRLLSLNVDQLASLRASYTYRLLQSYVRGTGWPNLFLGSLTFLLGIDGHGNPILKAIQALFGLVTVGVSIWSLASPMAIGAIGVAVWGILMGTIGIWNLFVALYQHSIIIGGLALLQLTWTYGYYLIYRKHSQTVKADNTGIRLYDELRQAVARFKDPGDADPDFIQVKIRNRIWQGFLLQDRAVLASRQSKLLLVAKQSKTTFTFKKSDDLLSQQIQGIFDFDGETIKRVTFPKVTVESYRRWKGGSAVEHGPVTA